jgi:hypothetical protein
MVNRENVPLGETTLGKLLIFLFREVGTEMLKHLAHCRKTGIEDFR